MSTPVSTSTREARRRSRRQVATGLAFLGPNILGFLTFTLVPLVFSLVLAFTNWDIRFHNMFKTESIRFAGLDNFARLFKEPYFLKFLGNTLFFMINIPLAIAGSLCAALLLVKDTRGGNRRVWLSVIAAAVLTASVLALWASHARGTAMTMLLAGLFGVFLVGGSLGGVSVYRTLFFIPHFTSGVAVYLLWKKLYSDIGPINRGLAAPLERLGEGVQSVSAAHPGLFEVGIAGLLTLAMAALGVALVRRLGRLWREGDVGTAALALPALFALLPAALYARIPAARFAVQGWPEHRTLLVAGIRLLPLAALAVAGAVAAARGVRDGQDYPTQRWKGSGNTLMLALAGMVGQFLLFGFARVAFGLPALAADGLEPPKWLNEYDWAKPAIMVMGLWGAIGSNNMLLYVAGLTNIPPELYEAADIDGASRSQRFWSITWPQLAPITFFIFIMSVIGGLQGGFEMARTMTKGGPAGATTTLSYFIYTQGFETGRFGSASGVAWALFALVLCVTLVNWKFGSRYVND